MDPRVWHGEMDRLGDIGPRVESRSRSASPQRDHDRSHTYEGV